MTYHVGAEETCVVLDELYANADATDREKKLQDENQALRDQVELLRESLRVAEYRRDDCLDALAGETNRVVYQQEALSKWTLDYLKLERQCELLARTVCEKEEMVERLESYLHDRD
jgi:hypothetical protein